MNRILILLAGLLMSTSALVSAQNMKFYDENGKELSRERFLKKKNNSRVYLGIDFQDGKTTSTKLIRRETTGKLPTDSAKLIYKALERAQDISLSGKLLILNYYPGADPCNSTGPQDKNLLTEKFNAYLRKVRSLKNAAQVFLYASPQGLDKYKDVIDWFPDPGHLIQNTFFKHHYPCGSYVIINPNGDYYAYYGEYALDDVIVNARKMSRQ